MSEDDLRRLADLMFAETVRDGQSARRVPDDADAERLRALVRDFGTEQAVRLRTARLDDSVLVARLDAQVWRDDRATMRAKLTPPA